jgi:hypothetical protein
MLRSPLVQGVILCACVLGLVSACNTPSTPLQSTGVATTEPVSFAVNDAHVRLVSATTNRLAASVQVQLEATEATGSVTTHRLDLRGRSPRNQQMGASARLLDAWGETQFEVGVAWNPESNVAQFWERSTVDELDFVIQENSGQIMETYTLNGEVRILKYPESTAADFEEALRRVRTGVGSSELPLDVAVEQFDRLYRSQHTLDDNPHGQLLVAIVTHPQFSDWLEGFLYPYGRDTYATIDRDKLCLIASACAATKCLAGGMANPLCTACGGVSIACVIADLVLWAFGEE